MSHDTEFLPFASGGGAAVRSQADWAADNFDDTGFAPGILTKERLNKALRQACNVAHATATIAMQRGAQNVPDDANLTNLYAALRRAFSPTVVCLEDFDPTGTVGTGNAAVDTAALQAAAAYPDIVIEGDPRKEYYFAAGVTFTQRQRIRNMRCKIKLGTGGFNSVDVGASTRYDASHALFVWSGSDGGGYENIEVYGDGGGDYVCAPLAVLGGMTTRPFIGRGVFYAHDLTGITNIFSLHGLGDPGAQIDTLVFTNIGTSNSSGSANAYGPQGYWTTNGSFGANDFTQVSCYVQDTDAPNSRSSGLVRIGHVKGRNIWIGGAAYAKHGWQTDLVTLGRNSSGGTNDLGIRIGSIEAYEVGEPLDCQQANTEVGRIVVDRCMFGAKVVHGGANIKFDRITARRFALNALVLSGSNSTPVADVDAFYCGAVDGSQAGGYELDTGTLSGSTASSNAVLATYSSAYAGVDNYYSAGANGGAIWITGGTGAGQVRKFTSYNGTTKTVSGLADIHTGSASNWSTTPDGTSTYAITPFGEVSGVSFQTEGSTSVITNSTVDNIAIRDQLGRLSNIVRSNLTDVSRNNRAVVARDFGFTYQFASAAATGPVRVVGGNAVRAFCQMTLSGDQTIASTSPTLVLFANKRQDTYDIPGSQGVQGSASENGIRVRSPGPKTFNVKVGYGSWTAGEACTLSLYRNGALVYSKTFSSQSTGAFNCDATWHVNHAETYKDFRNGGGNENLYQVYVTHSAATSHTISGSTGTCTTEFTVMG